MMMMIASNSHAHKEENNSVEVKGSMEEFEVRWRKSFFSSFSFFRFSSCTIGKGFVSPPTFLMLSH